MRLRHGPHKFALHAIPLINDIGERLVKTKILYVGATLKHCFLFIRVSDIGLSLRLVHNIKFSLFLEISGEEAGTVVVEIADGNREEADGDSTDDLDARYEGPRVERKKETSIVSDRN